MAKVENAPTLERAAVAQRIAEAGRTEFEASGRAGGANRIKWIEKDLRVFEVKEAPAYSDSWPEYPGPALRMVLDVRDADGKSVIDPRANPFFFVGLPDEIGGDTDPEAAIRMLARIAVAPKLAARER